MTTPTMRRLAEAASDLYKKHTFDHAVHHIIRGEYENASREHIEQCSALTRENLCGKDVSNVT